MTYLHNEYFSDFINIMTQKNKQQNKILLKKYCWKFADLLEIESFGVEKVYIKLHILGVFI